MKHYINNILILSLSFLLISCEDFFETDIALEQPDFVSQLTASTIITRGQDLVVIYVGKNGGLLENSENYRVDDAMVTITRTSDNNTINVGSSDIFNLYNYTTVIPVDFFRGAENYTFNFEHPDYPLSSTTLMIPESVSLSEELQFIFDDGVSNEGELTSSVTIQFFDDPTQENYYEIAIIKDPPNLTNEPYNIFAWSFDPAAEKGENGDNILLSDKSFNGQDKQFTFYLDQAEIEGYNQSSIFLSFRAVNKGYYNFDKTLRKYYENNDNPFVSPTLISSNVNNGLGTISLKNDTIYPIEW